MQPVGKKQRKKPKTWQLIALLSVLVLLVALMLVLQKKSAVPLPKSEDHSIVLIKKNEADLIKMEVTNKSGDRFTLVKDKKDFRVLGQDDFLLEAVDVSLMVKDLTLLIANELAGEVHTTQEALDLLGLGQSAPRAKATYTDGSSLTVVFGNSAQTEVPSDYLMFEGDNKVYFVSPETREHFDRALTSLHQIPSINFNERLVDSIEIVGDEQFTLSHQENLWELKSPYSYPLDDTKVSTMLTSIGKMRFAQYFGKAEELQLDELGLFPPKRTITFHLSQSTITGFDKEGAPIDSTLVPEQTLTLAFGNNIDLIGLYCLYEGKVYQATNVSMGFLRDLTALSLLSPGPVTLPLNRVTQLEVLKAGRGTRYAIDFIEKILPNNQIELDKDGNTLYEPYVTVDGKEIDADKFVREYLKLMALKHSGRLPKDYVPKTSEPTIMITLHTLQGQSELALFPYGDLHYAMGVNGVFIDYIQKAQVDEIDL